MMTEAMPVIRLGLVGEFNAGKSSIVNFLISRELMPADIFPTTTTINIAKHGEVPALHVHYHDGRISTHGIGEISNYIADNGSYDNIKFIVIDSPDMPIGVELIDTPGFNDPNPARDKIVLELLPQLDGILFVTDATQPLKNSELPYIKSSFGRFSFENTLLIVNHSDLLKTPERVNAVVRHVSMELDKVSASLFEIEKDLGVTPRRKSFPNNRIFVTCAVRDIRSNLEPSLKSLIDGSMSRLADTLIDMGRDRGEVHRKQAIANQRLNLLSELSAAQALIDRHDNDLSSTAMRCARIKKQAEALYESLNSFYSHSNNVRNDTPAILNEIIDNSLSALQRRVSNPNMLNNPMMLEMDIKQFLTVTIERMSEIMQSHFCSQMGQSIALAVNAESQIKEQQLDLGAVTDYTQSQVTASFASHKVAGAGGLISTALYFTGNPMLALIGALVSSALPLMNVSSVMGANVAHRDKAVQSIIIQVQQILMDCRKTLVDSLDSSLKNIENDLIKYCNRLQWSIIHEAYMNCESKADVEYASERVAILKNALVALPSSQDPSRSPSLTS